MEIFNIIIQFKRIREIDRKDYVTKQIQEHGFNIATRRYTN